jgi:hypothetical protein
MFFAKYKYYAHIANITTKNNFNLIKTFIYWGYYINEYNILCIPQKKLVLFIKLFFKLLFNTIFNINKI